MAPKSRILRILMLILFFTLCCCHFVPASCEKDFEVTRIGNIHSYADNAFRIRSSEAGSLKISIRDPVFVFRTIREEVPAGETTVHWDGCGYNREKLYEKTYTITAELKTVSGEIRTVSFDSPVEYPVQCLQYALPSDSVFSLDHPENWFLEYKTVTDGKLLVRFISASDATENYTYSISADGGKPARKTLPEIAGRKDLPSPGEYILSVSEETIPDEAIESVLCVIENEPEPDPVRPTGEIMPDRNMTDSEIWGKMMQPSVVVDIDSFRHQDVYTEPDPDSPSLGTLHGQTQGLKVIRTEDDWALIGAWNHEDASYIEGWVPLSKLKTEKPRGEYGLLIDKQKQTMTVYRNGEPIDTLLVSTGRAEKDCLFQETSAGCFLTGYHRVNFSMNGKKYDYVIQYDGGNLLHQTPYEWGQHKKDFTLGRAYLGAKASHACIRIQPEAGNGGLNAYWLFTHLPYHTRVIILDDPWERESTAEKLRRNKQSDIDLSALSHSGRLTGEADRQVILTFGGCMTPGGDRIFNSRKNSFSAFTETNGYDLPLHGLKKYFESDDLTFVTLNCSIMSTPDTFPDGKGTLFAPSGSELLFANASIELTDVPEEEGNPDGLSLRDGTAAALRLYTDVMEGGQYRLYSLKGHLFGFTACSDNEYLKDPAVIDRKLSALNEAGCEKAVILFRWSDCRQNTHSVVQEAMARRSVRAGADLVIGNCPGIVQGIDLIEGVPVIYSTGDLLVGNSAVKPKTQQGILVRAVFSFQEGEDDVTVTVIPIMPCGSSGTKENEYTPSSDLSSLQAETIIRYVWTDSTDAALDRFQFFCPDQS